MRRSIRGALALLAFGFAGAASADVFFSEYVEGTSNNKAVEIVNTGASAVSLSGYSIAQYSNGNATAGFTFVLPAVTVPAGGVAVFCNNAANLAAAIQAACPAANRNGSLNYNGNDALELRFSGAVVDSIGQVGNDPGAAGWGTDPANTMDNTIRRKASVCTGDANSGNAFNPATEFDGFAVDTFDGLGSHTSNCGGVAATSFAINDVAIAEGNTGTTNLVFTVTKTGPAASDVTFATANGTATTPEDYASTTDSLVFAAADATKIITVAIAGDTVDEDNETFMVTLIGPTNGATLSDASGIGTITNDDLAVGMACGDPATLISAVQGAGSATPLAANNTTQIEGIVVGDFQGPSGIGGFFVQEEDLQRDTNELTSEGIFVFEDAGTPASVSINDRVRVMGMVTERFNQTVIMGPTTQLCAASQTPPTATAVSLPFAALDSAERVEGMKVTLPQQLFVTDNFTLGRFGEVVLSSGNRLVNPTQNNLPGAAAQAALAANNLNKILIDDGNATQNRDPIVYPNGGLSASNTLRGGDTVTGIQGVMGFDFGAYRVQPTVAPVFVPTNPRTAMPDLPGAANSFRIASFNVLNYFNGNGAGGGFPTARGADTAAEFTRQRNKIIPALTAMKADVIGVIEMENDDFSTTSALADLVNGLNAAAPGGTTYAFVTPPIADLNNGTNPDGTINYGSGSKLGTDEIKVSFIYRTQTASLVGAAKVLDNRFNAAYTDNCNRPALAQTFQQVGSTTRLTVAVNHFKSKGSPCGSLGDADTGDGQGNGFRARLQAAQVLRDWLATDPTGSGDPDFLVIGDLNSYAKEDPIRTLETAGYINVVQRDSSEPAVLSYPFDDTWGTLDYGLASNSLAPSVTKAVEWTINGAEPISLDYNVEFKSVGQQTSLYNADPYRSSDHDPVVVEIAACLPGELSFSSTPASVTEGGNLLVTVQRTGGTCGTVGVSYATASGTAAQGTDFTAASGTLNFGTGEASKTFTVATTQDPLNEVDETFSLTLTNATGGATLAAGGDTASRAIDNDDPLPTVAFAAGSSSFAENASVVTVTVNLNTASGRDVTVPFTVSGTATPGAGGDYTQGTTSPLVIPAGATSRTLSFTITDDTVQEPSETIVLAIETMVMNANTGTPATHTLTIVDNDAPAGDATPDAFDFGTKTNQAPASLVVSDVQTPTGFNAAAAIVPGPGASYRINGGAWVKSNGTLQPGQTLQVRHTTSSATGEFTKTYVRVGGVKAFFTTQTR